MSKEDVLNKLRNNGINKGYFEEKRLCDLKKSCSKSEIIVIDYDETKDRVNECLSGFKQFESCDALNIKKECLDFIEMKSLDEYLKHYTKKQYKKFKDKDFATKYTDSIYLLSNLLNRNDMNIERKERTLILQSIGQYIVLIDREYKKDRPEELLTRLEYLTDISTLESKLIEDAFEEVAAVDESEEEQRLNEVIEKIQDDLRAMRYIVPHSVNAKIMTPNEFEKEYDYI